MKGGLDHFSFILESLTIEMKEIAILPIQSISDVVTNSSTELFLINTQLEPNKYLPTGFPEKERLKQFPYKAFEAWLKFVQTLDLKLTEEDEDRTLSDNGIPTTNVWYMKELFYQLSKHLVEQEFWTERKWELYMNYLTDPRTRYQSETETLGKIYKPLDVTSFSLWDDVRLYLRDNFTTPIVPYDEEKVKYAGVYKKYKDRVYEGGYLLTSLDCAEFLRWSLPEKYIKEFITKHLSRFPGLNDLIDIYSGGKALNLNTLRNSWYLTNEDSEAEMIRQDYGSEKYYKELDRYYGNKYYMVRLNM